MDKSKRFLTIIMILTFAFISLVGFTAYYYHDWISGLILSPIGLCGLYLSTKLGG